MCIRKFLKNKRIAQSAVEFAIIAPVLVLILLMIIQIGQAFSIRNTISAGTRSLLMQVSSKYNNLTGTEAAKTAQLESILQGELAAYLSDHNIPNPNNIKVKISTNSAARATFVSVTYNYKLALPLIPGTPNIPLQTSQLINTAMIKENIFNSGLTTQRLSTFFPVASGALTTGGMIAGYPIRDNIAFLVAWYDEYFLANINSDIYARLFNWYGEDLLPANTRINVRTATIEVRSPYYNNGNWFNTQIPYVWVTTALDYSHIYFVKYNSTVSPSALYGHTLNACNESQHVSYLNCPSMYGSGATYYYLYRINPLLWSDTIVNNFYASYGYRWCGGGGGTVAACTSSQYGAHTIQELGLKGITRESWFCGNHGINFTYSINGNYEYIKNSGSKTLEYLGRYIVKTADHNNPNGVFQANIYQPLVRGYYTAGEPVDPAKLSLNDTNTTDSNGNTTPFFTAFKWSFNLNSSGIYNAAGAANYDIVDVYVDSDADGIPDAWDNYPTWFDRDGNGQLDGLQKTMGANNDLDENFTDVVDTGANVFNMTLPNPGGDGARWPNTVGWTNYVFPVPNVTANIASPVVPHVGRNILNHSKKNNSALKSYLPSNIADMGFFNFKQIYFSAPTPPILPHYKLYMPCNNDAASSPDNPFDGLCRQSQYWDANLSTRLTQKSRFINGTSNGSVINLNKSAELNYLDTYNFSTANKIIRTPGTW